MNLSFLEGGRRGWRAVARATGVVVLMALARASRAAEAGAPAGDKPVPPPGLPRWELGLAGVGAYMPYYLGSDEYRTYAFPLPYGVYRAQRLQIDRDGFRGFFYRNPMLETDISIAGSPPVGNDTEARRGMEDLDPLVEFGPAVRLILYRGERLAALQLESAVRGVMALDVGDFTTQSAGTRATLGVALASFTPARGSPWRGGLSTGVEFGDRAYHGYFYDVTGAEALPGRPAHRSPGGYGGCYLSGFVSRRLTPGMSLSAYTRWNHLDGAAYEDSPLVKERDNVTVGAAFVWKLAESKTRVERR